MIPGEPLNQNICFCTYPIHIELEKKVKTTHNHPPHYFPSLRPTPLTDLLHAINHAVQ